MTNANRKSANPAPLKSWALAFAITALLAGGLAAAVHRATVSEQNQLVDYERGRLRSFGRNAGSGRDDKRVIGLGTSLLACATYFDGAMESFSRDRGCHLQYLRITRPSMTFDELSDQLDYVLAARPNILIIERDPLYFKIYQPNLSLSRYWEFAQGLLRELFSWVTGIDVRKKKPGLPNILDDDSQIDKLSLDKGPSVLSNYVAMRRDFGKPDWNRSRELIERFMGKARKCGITIILLGIPRAPEAETLVSRSERALMSAYAAYYRQRYGVLSLEYPQRLGPEYFRDYSHLTARGREFFSLWLISEIRNIAPSGGQN